MTLTELRYIAILANVQHFGRAAEQCFVSQPTLSIAVKKIEAELGVEIFERSKNLVYLTPIGKKIVEQSLKVLDEASTIKDIASTGKDQLNVPLSLGAIFTIGPYLLPSFLSSLKKIAPDMPLIIEEGYTNSLKKRLLNGEVDVIIVARPFEEPDVVVQPLFDEPFMAVLSREHPLATRDSLDLKSIEKENILIFKDGDCFGEPIMQALDNINQNTSNQISLSIETKIRSLETLCYMISSGLGISIMPMSATQAPTFQSTNLVSVPFRNNILKRSIAMAWRASFPRHEAIDTVRKAIFSSQNIDADKRTLAGLTSE